MKVRDRGRRTRYLLLALALASGIALAVPTGEAQAVDPVPPCGLTVRPVDPDNESAADLASVEIVYDLYQVASAVYDDSQDAYTYTLLEAYKSLTIGNSPDDAKWMEAAQAAARIAFESGAEPDRPGQDIKLPVLSMDCGVYLLVARGKDLEDYIVTVKTEEGAEGAAGEQIATVVRSDRHTYTFLPILVMLPAQETAEDGSVFWNYQLEVTLKPSRDPRFGSLEIVKTLTSYKAGEPAVFVFQIEAVLGTGEDAEVVYSDVVSLTFTGPGEQKVLISDKIPVGAEVTVTEVYSGTVYRPTSSSPVSVVVGREDAASVHFTNEYEETNRHGGAITNRFEHTSGDWNWTQTGGKTGSPGDSGNL